MTIHFAPWCLWGLFPFISWLAIAFKIGPGSEWDFMTPMLHIINFAFWIIVGLLIALVLK